MDWKEGTYFSVAVWGYRSWWKVIDDIDNETCNCLFIKGTDPRMFSNGGMFNGFRKGYYDYGGREENQPVINSISNWLLGR